MLVGRSGRARGAVTFANPVAFTGAGWRWAVVVAGAARAVVLGEGGGGEGGSSEEQEQTEGRGFHGRMLAGRLEVCEPGLPGRRARPSARASLAVGQAAGVFGGQAFAKFTITVKRMFVNSVFGNAGELLRAC